jgi:glycerol-3-phosphate dehydrogenase (NAD(P)+)
MTHPSFAVIGAGSWGTALSLVLSRNGHTVHLWAKEADHIAVMVKERENKRYLPGIHFPDLLRLSPSLEDALQQSTDILIAVPSHAFAEVVEKIAPYLRPDQGILWATKGLDHSARFLHEVVIEKTGVRPLALITGPSFAKEVADALPTAVTVAHTHLEYGQHIQRAFQSPYFRVYLNDDLIGAELGGALKNVIALAVGIAEGLGFRTNTKAALMTRGLAEMMRLGHALGAKRETLMGLSGLGDLILTCSDTQSRNLRFGIMLGQGLSRDEACQKIGQVIESIHTAKLVFELAQKHGVRMPISDQVYAILYEHLSCAKVIDVLLVQTHAQME